MRTTPLKHVALLALVVILAQGTSARAGTTGALSGYVLLPDSSPVAGAKVTATSPTQSATTISDTRGHFAFISLVPDTYTVVASKDGYDTATQPGVTVIADNTRTITLNTRVSVKTLAREVVRAASGELVKPGTTADVYSVNASTQAKVSSLGGGGSLNQAYAALAATPGVVVPPGGNGWFQTVQIRGGDYDQVGYEFDGVPVLRSYDNYPTTNASTLGQQELQVYTGAAPANSESQGLSGYINQVIKSGTYPGFSNLTLGVGSPAEYNSYNFEIGGATPDRNFSYYLGSLVSSQQFRYIDQFNGASYTSTLGTPFAPVACPTTPDPNIASCYASGIGPGGYVLGPTIDSVYTSNVWDRENVVNLHFGIPHHNDPGKDDIQLLYDVSYLNNLYYGSASDWGFNDPAVANAYGGSAYPYVSGPGIGYQYLGPVGAPLQSNYAAMTNPVYFAYNPASIGSNSPNLQNIPFNQRDGTANENSILKLQYQHNFGTAAYFRIYGFSNYSEWPQTCPVTVATDYIGYCPYNYYVRTSTTGGSASYGNQINDKNLLTATLSDFGAIDYRANDDTMINELIGLNYNTGADAFAYAVNANNPTAGVCYSSGTTGVDGGTTPPKFGAPVSCYSEYALQFGLAAANSGAALPTLPAKCGSGPCEWFTAENGRYGGGNYAKPNFGTVSVTDQWKPSARWFVNLGVREDRFFYQLSNTGGPARDFWFNSWNNSYCVIPGAGQVPVYNPANDATVGAPCSTFTQNGIPTVPATMTNLPNDTETFWVFQPRLGATYQPGQSDVLRFSAGRYDQPPNTAYEQYNLLQQDLASYDAQNFWPIGFTTTTHAIYPATSDNFDFSWEHNFTGAQASFKLTPFYRQTQNQIQNFYLNQKTGFVSGLNVGTQTAQGVEFQFNWGNFNQNGLSALLAYTYTDSFIKFKALNNGGTVLDTINIAIQQYNSFTSSCAGAAASSSTTTRCGTYGKSNAFPCFDPTTNSGLTSCTSADVANPYWNAPAQATLDPNANYEPFGTIPGAIEANASGYEVPSSATLVLNYKHDKWAVSPQFQLQEGVAYGDPLSGYGVDPSSCTATLKSPVAGDPRYPYGGTGAAYDAMSCGGTIAAPDPYTGVFDAMGAFRGPSQFLMHMQISYDLSSRTTFTINMANIINSCFGGTREPWNQFQSRVTCGQLAYVLPGYAPLSYGANIYNPGVTFQPVVKYPYMANPDASPFEMVFSAKFSL
jgi:Carboxypeptidase regulatory-like domain/TonB-dependent Receptor Plug Domain